MANPADLREVWWEDAAHSEDCQCPLPPEDFYNRFQCAKEDEVSLQKLLEQWTPKKVTWESFNAAREAIRCVIVQNELFCSPQPQLSGWAAFRTLLLSLLRKVNIPNVEFYWQSEPDMTLSNEVPILGPFSSPGSPYIPIPTTPIIDLSFNGRNFDLACSTKIWELRKPGAFYRSEASPSVGEKSIEDLLQLPQFKAAKISKEAPEMLDARVIVGEGLEGSLAAAEKLGLLGKGGVSVGEAFEYQVILDVDERPKKVTPWEVLWGGSVLAAQVRERKEWYELAFTPNQQYLPVEESLDNVAQVLREALTDEASLTALRASSGRHVLRRLRSEDLLCWTARALHGLAGAAGFEVEVRPGMERQEQPMQECACNWGG